MKKLRPIKLYGNTAVIQLTKTDLSDLDLTIGDLVDIADLKKEKGR